MFLRVSLSAVITLVDSWASGFCLPAFAQAVQYLSVPEQADGLTITSVCPVILIHLETVKSPTSHVHYFGPFLAAEDKKTKEENNHTLLSFSMKALMDGGPSPPFCIAPNILNRGNPFSDISQTGPCLH